VKTRGRAGRLVDALLVAVSAVLLFAGWSAPAYADGCGPGPLSGPALCIPMIVPVAIIVCVCWSILRSARGTTGAQQSKTRPPHAKWLRMAVYVGLLLFALWWTLIVVSLTSSHGYYPGTTTTRSETTTTSTEAR